MRGGQISVRNSSSSHTHSQVNKMAGELHYSAVHLAAQRNSTELISLLFQHGADLELRNAEHLPPLALTTSYEVR